MTRDQRATNPTTSQTFGPSASNYPRGAIEEAAEILNQGKRIVILAGQGALGAGMNWNILPNF